MHQTTVRFGPDLWEALERECELLGVSVAQYVRESALTRLVYGAGRRGDDEFELALDLATGAGDGTTWQGREPAEFRRERAEPTPNQVRAREAQVWARDEKSQSTAVVAQGQLARARARRLRERAKDVGSHLS